MEFIHKISAGNTNGVFSSAYLAYDKEYYIEIGIYPNQVFSPHMFFTISIERPDFITKQVRNLSNEEKIWLNEFMKRKWPIICKFVKKHCGHNVTFRRPDYTRLPDFLYNNDIEGDRDVSIHRFRMPDIGLCEIIVKPYREYPVFYIEKSPSRELVSIISMIEPIYMVKNCIRLNIIQKKRLIDVLSENVNGPICHTIWDIIKMIWNGSGMESIYSPIEIPDYTKLPE